MDAAYVYTRNWGKKYVIGLLEEYTDKNCDVWVINPKGKKVLPNNEKQI